ncbi:MAG: hypothetical protein GY934_13525 [Gammaproteobacteria bacterium]|nr:hypothetical protein [Gammaproteobacteria bacterium]
MTKFFADKVNGVFEVCGGFFITLHIAKLVQDKSVAGVDWRAIAFFTVWGWWNCWYYPKLKQWRSFVGGAFVALVNTVWLILLLYYGGMF